MALIKYNTNLKKQRNPIAAVITGIVGGVFCLVMAMILLAKLLFG